MKSAFLLLLIITATPLGFGQTSNPSESVSVCNLTSAQLPAIRGLKLGMPLNEVLALFPGAGDDDNVKHQLSNAKGSLLSGFAPGNDGYGLASLQIHLPSYSSNPKFTGIGNIHFRFFDDKLISLSLAYSKTIWNNADEFVAKLAEAYKLPSASAWLPKRETSRELRCKDFSVNIHAAVGSLSESSLSLTQLESGWDDIRRRQQERRTAAIVQAQRDFKP